MPKRSRTKTVKPKPNTKYRRPKKDENRAAFDVLLQVIQQTEGTGKDPIAVALGRRGGLKGGKARAEKLTAEERHESAVKAAKARWGSGDHR
jgi:hypothetical protein